MERDAHQLELFAPQRTAAALAAALSRSSGLNAHVTVTRNRVAMISVRIVLGREARLRLHEAFLDAPDSVLAELAAYLRTRRRSHWQAVARFARGIRTGPGRPPRQPTPSPTSRCHDLPAIASDVNRTFFQGRIRCAVRWGRQGIPRRRSRRSIRFGSWNEHTRTVTVHPALDSAEVPLDFVRYIVYHEMLHAAVPHEWKNGEDCAHTRAFRALERRFPDYPRMRRLAAQLVTTLTPPLRRGLIR